MDPAATLKLHPDGEGMFFFEKKNQKTFVRSDTTVASVS
jgi:hypothetical protein